MVRIYTAIIPSHDIISGMSSSNVSPSHKERSSGSTGWKETSWTMVVSWTTHPLSWMATQQPYLPDGWNTDFPATHPANENQKSGSENNDGIPRHNKVSLRYAIQINPNPLWFYNHCIVEGAITALYLCPVLPGFLVYSESVDPSCHKNGPPAIQRSIRMASPCT